MISKGDYYVIHELFEQGYSIRKIAKIVNLDRKTVTRRLKQVEYKTKENPSANKASMLEPYKAYIKDFISKDSYRLKQKRKTGVIPVKDTKK